MMTLSVAVTAAAADSGPKAGSVEVPFQVFDATGPRMGETIDIVALRAGKPTLYCFIPVAHWTRPTARLLRTLDQSITQTTADGAVVAVWVTDDAPAAREYLPKAQQSLQLTHSALTVYEQSGTGPGEWGINTDVPLTVVAARDGKVVRSFVLDAPNETDAEELLKALK